MLKPSQESIKAFNKAIKEGRLREDKTAGNYAGNYMYMGRANGLDLFKHIETRRYLPHSVPIVTAG